MAGVVLYVNGAVGEMFRLSDQMCYNGYNEYKLQITPVLPTVPF